MCFRACIFTFSYLKYSQIFRLSVSVGAIKYTIVHVLNEEHIFSYKESENKSFMLLTLNFRRLPLSFLSWISSTHFPMKV